jgi:hypothetical protein
VYGDNVNIIAISETYNVSCQYLLVSEIQIIEPQTVIAGQVVIERNAYLLSIGELDNDHCDNCCQSKRNR